MCLSSAKAGWIGHSAVAVGCFNSVGYRKFPIGCRNVDTTLTVITILDLSFVLQTSLSGDASRGVKSSYLLFVKREQLSRECSRQATCSALSASFCSFNNFQVQLLLSHQGML
jgi:hypothetical protein